jgi:hypothetical protein
MGRHIIITVYFAEDSFQQMLKDCKDQDELDYYLEYSSYKQAHQEMKKRRSDAMEDIMLYMNVWNDFEAYLTDEMYGSQCIITLPKKTDLDAGIFSLVYHLFQRGDIAGFTVMHTGA